MSWNFFSNKRKSALGLDVSDVSLKLTEFERNQGGFRVQAYSEEMIPKDVVAADTIRDPQALIKVIKKAIAQPKFGKVTTSRVVASIPETKCFVRVIQMAAVSAEEAKEAIPWEAEAYIPMPIGQVYLDWVILSADPELRQKDKKDSKMTVLITAAPKDYIDDYTRILKEASLEPIALEIESQATARSLVAKLEETVLILDINTLRTSFIVYDHQTLQFTSSVPIGGSVFTEGVARSLGVSTEEAEKIKRRDGLDETKNQGSVKTALTPILNNLVSEIKNIIRFYDEHSLVSSRISRILLSGGSSKLKHLPSALAERLSDNDESAGIKVELGNPWVKVLGKKQTPPLSREDSLSYATAIGLALREFEE